MKEIRVSKTLIFILIVLGIWAGVYTIVPFFFAKPPSDPHLIFFTEDICLECHEGTPEITADKKEDKKEKKPKKRRIIGRKLNFEVANFYTKDFISMCTDKCHSYMYGETLHPMEIKPTKMKSEKLPLGFDGTLTCVTCHYPHNMTETGKKHFSTKQYVGRSSLSKLFSLFIKQKFFKTYFLRMKVKKGELCNECHEPKELKKPKHLLEMRYSTADYAGSKVCGNCHPKEYEMWKLTPHARTIGNPQLDMSDILGDFKDKPPFALTQVKYSVGVHWTQEYISKNRRKGKRKGKLYVRAPKWSIQKEEWDIPKTPRDKPWGKYCSGCHVTGYIPTDGYAELGITCEACHGPGKKHVKSSDPADIVNPNNLFIDPELSQRRDMICEGCHTTGHDMTGEFKFPLNFQPGDDISVYYKGLMARPGQRMPGPEAEEHDVPFAEDPFRWEGDNTYDDRHRQFLYFQDTFFLPGKTCDRCGNIRERMKQAMMVKEGIEPAKKPKKKKEKPFTPSEFCMTCHKKEEVKSLGDEKTQKMHGYHIIKDVNCHDCHQPKLSPDENRYSIHDHKFMFIKPKYKKQFTVEESCKNCHKDKKL